MSRDAVPRGQRRGVWLSVTEIGPRAPASHRTCRERCAPALVTRSARQPLANVS
ncbi:hypothetical protein ACFPM0_01555 [Pseudonocardia sulfidoxydans]|uniref:hypothetical protein n=1 Tax=Pseudonocardia sulfidoxydans TaxID=54011 RepID=UPI003605D1FC